MNARDAVHQFRLYIAGHAHNSVEALANLRKICGDYLPGQYEIEIVDVFVHPARAMRDGIFMTPTLVKLAPGVPRTIVGTLSHTQTVLQALELSSQAA